MNAFPESYDELAVLAHHGATDDELTRRLAEREQMGLEERFHADLAARGHYGPNLDDHRNRWAGDHGREQKTPPAGGCDVDEPDEPAAEDNADDDVPDGTAVDVLDWAGTSPARARAAIAAEEKKDNPRTSLIAKLRRFADG